MYSNAPRARTSKRTQNSHNRKKPKSYDQGPRQPSIKLKNWFLFLKITFRFFSTVKFDLWPLNFLNVILHFFRM